MKTRFVCSNSGRALLPTLALLTLHAGAGTVAHWRFEGDGTTTPAPGSQVEDTNGRAVTNTGLGVRVADVSGNGNTIWAWDHAAAGMSYSDLVPFAMVPQTGQTNTLSIQNAGNYPAAFTWSRESVPAVDVETIKPLAWTIEASIRATANNGYRTFVGRDGNGVGPDANAAPFYFQTVNGVLRVNFTDEGGRNYILDDSSGAMALNTWYSVAAVSDGTTLTLHRHSGAGYVQVGSLTLTAGDTRLGYDDAGSSTVNDTQWGWTLGRGRYGALNGQADNHGDRWAGFIDEVRISDSALAPSEFLGSFSAADSDGDGLPNSWEITFSLDPNDNGLTPNNNGVAGNPDNGAQGDPDADSFGNLAEYNGGTASSDPRDGDSVPGDVDGDDLPDTWEMANFANYEQDLMDDPDGDFATNGQELAATTDPDNRLEFPEFETTPDQMPDGWETLHFAGTERDGSGDFDEDGVADLLEWKQNTVPTDIYSNVNPTGDIDGDLLDDRWEALHFNSVIDQDGGGDPDNDGAGNTNLDEYRAGSNPVLPAFTATDVNGDGLADVVSFIDFTSPGTSGITDAQGEFTGLVRLANTGTNPAYLPNDPFIDLNSAGTGTFTFRTETTDFNGQSFMSNMAALGINLSTLGFTGSQDFRVRVKFVNMPAMGGADQLGIFAGASSTALIRGGRIGAADSLGVNTNGNNDSAAVFPAQNVASLAAGKAMTVELSRSAGVWALSVHGIDITPAVQPDFLNPLSDLTVGFFGSDLFTGNAHKNPVVESLTVVRMGSANPDGDNDGMDDAWEILNLGGGGRDGSGDLDHDGVADLAEFAFNGDPDNGASRGGITSALQDTNGNSLKELTLTIAVRSGATFAAGPAGVQTATIGGLTYTVRGSLDLNAFDSAVSHSGSVPSGDPGYELHTFRLDASDGLAGRGFLQALATHP